MSSTAAGADDTATTGCAAVEVRFQCGCGAWKEPVS
jgi:hypothetical protein